MTSTLDLHLAGHPIRFEVSDPELFDQVRTRCRGFVVEPSEPWLRLELARRREPRDAPTAAAAVRRDGRGGWVIRTPRGAGDLVPRPGERWVARGEVHDLTALGQFFYTCLALLLPGRGALLLHADTVAIDGGALAFLGPSGAGKSTAATELMGRAGAERLAEDRSVVLLPRAPGRAAKAVAVPMPRFMADWSQSVSAERRAPLTALVFPRRGENLELRRMAPPESLQRLLRSVIMPRGQGLPVEPSLAVGQALLEGVGAAELTWSPGHRIASLLREMTRAAPRRAAGRTKDVS